LFGSFSLDAAGAEEKKEDEGAWEDEEKGGGEMEIVEEAMKGCSVGQEAEAVEEGPKKKRIRSRRRTVSLPP
jgi:hypothetical protein